MATFQSQDEMLDILGAFLQQMMQDPALGPKMATADVTMLVTYTDPDTTLLLDCKQNPPVVTFNPPADVESEFKMAMSADDGHKFWQGKFNVALALARKKVTVEGNLAKMMKLLPAVQACFPKYEQFLKEKGREDLLG